MKLVLENIGYRHRGAVRDAVTNVNWTVESGSYWCLSGPNGCGKSTLLQRVCALLPLQGNAGSARIDAGVVDALDRKIIAQQIAFVPASITRGLTPLTVREFVLQSRYARISFLSAPNAADRDAVDSILKRLSLVECANAFVSTLSSGLFQLTMLARALAQDTPILLLDETTTNLDLNHQERFFGLLDEENRRGKTILLVTHDLNLALEHVPNLAWMADGSLVAKGSSKEMISEENLKQIYGEGFSGGTNPLNGKPKIFRR